MTTVAQKSVLISISILVACAMAETGLRAVDFSYPSFYLTDKVVGTRLRPGAEGWYREEGNAYIKISTDGWRDRIHDRQKEVNNKRIAILGDSYAEALQVSEDDAFWRVFERQVNACMPFGNMPVEIMNFGVSGYSTAQELLVLRNRIWSYSPDIVVLSFVHANDVRDNSKGLSRAYPRPYYTYVDGSLALDRDYVHSLTHKVKSSLPWRLLQRGSDNLRLLQLTGLLLHRLDKMVTSLRGQQKADDLTEPGLDDDVYLEPRTSEWEEAWRVTEDLLGQMAHEVHDSGGRFVVAMVSDGMQVHPNPEVRNKFARRMGIRDPFYPERRLKALAEKLNIELIPLSPRLQAYAEKHQVYLHGFERRQLGKGHWNEAGHREAGQAIAEHFCSTP